MSFEGSTDNPYRYMVNADLFVSPSYYESFGLVILEAMLLGLPIIATATTGAAALTDNGRLGILVHNNDTALEAALIAAVKNADHYRSLYAEAAGEAALKYDVPAFKSRLIELLEQHNDSFEVKR